MSFHDRRLRAQALLASACHLPSALERKDEEPSMLEIKKGMEDFMRTFEQFRTKNDQELTELKARGSADVLIREESEKLNARLDEIKTFVNAEMKKLNRPELDKNGNEISAELKEYNTKFETFFRKGEDFVGGRAALQELEAKALAVQNDPDGGYTVRPEMDSAIDAVLKEVSPMRDFAAVRTIGADSFKRLVNQHGTNSGWVDETDGRPQTEASKFAALDFPVKECYAMPAATQKMLDDSFLNIEQWMADEVSLEFAQQEGRCFVKGNGIAEPKGFLSYATVADANWAWGKIGYTATGKDGGFNVDANGIGGADELIDLYHSLRPAFRANAAWMMNSATLAKARKLKDGQGNYLINRNMATDGIVETIMGKRVAEMIDMPDPANGSFSVAFGDWKRAYLIVDRKGVRVLRDPYTAKPYVLFYTTKRVGGGVSHFQALKLLKFSAS